MVSEGCSVPAKRHHGIIPQTRSHPASLHQQFCLKPNIILHHLHSQFFENEIQYQNLNHTSSFTDSLVLSNSGIMDSYLYENASICSDLHLRKPRKSVARVKMQTSGSEVLNQRATKIDSNKINLIVRASDMTYCTIFELEIRAQKRKYSDLMLWSFLSSRSFSRESKMDTGLLRNNIKRQYPIKAYVRFSRSIYRRVKGLDILSATTSSRPISLLCIQMSPITQVEDDEISVSSFSSYVGEYWIEIVQARGSSSAANFRSTGDFAKSGAGTQLHLPLTSSTTFGIKLQKNLAVKDLMMATMINKASDFSFSEGFTNYKFDDLQKLFDKRMVEYNSLKRVTINLGIFSVMVDMYSAEKKFTETIENGVEFSNKNNNQKMVVKASKVFSIHGFSCVRSKETREVTMFDFSNSFMILLIIFLYQWKTKFNFKSKSVFHLLQVSIVILDYFKKFSLIAYTLPD